MAEATVKRYPIRGLLWGILMGIGLAVTAIGMKWAAIGTNAPFVFFAIGLVISLAWSMFGPPKGPKGPEPAAPFADPEPPAAEAAEAAEDAAAEPEMADTAADTGDTGVDNEA